MGNRRWNYGDYGTFGAVDIIIVDSVAALVPRAEIDWRHGRLPRRTSGEADVPGAAEADRGDR